MKPAKLEIAEAAVDGRMGRSGEIVAHAESAVRTTRVLLGVSACFVLVAYRPLAGSASWWTVGVVPAVIALAVLVLNAVSVRAQHTQGLSTRWMVLSQGLDVAATVGLVVALEAPLQGEAWVLLVVPVVSGSIRLGAAASMLSWAGGCATYAALTMSGLATVPASGDFLIRTSGILVVVAATIGILARWMREGWEVQNELTEAASTREARLAVVQAASRAMARVSPDEALRACLGHTLALEFAATTIRERDATRPGLVVGRADLVAKLDTAEPIEAGEVVVTKWVQDGLVAVHSASTIETHTNTVITAWSEQEIDAQQADAFNTLVAHASTAMETASLLAQTRDEAAHDPLTRLANRRVLEEELDRYAASDDEIAVIFIDIDHFKTVNDQHGHLIGDEVLTAVGKRLRSSVRPTDLVARIGGDEFVILLRGINPTRAQQAGEAIVAAMNTPIAVSGLSLHAHISIGLATATAPLNAKELLNEADRALYQAKTAGRNQLAHAALKPQRTSDAPTSPHPPTTADRSQRTTPEGEYSPAS